MAGKIDQAKRLNLLRRLREGDRTAIGELADLYAAAGYRALATATRTARTNAAALKALLEQADILLGD